MIDKQELRRLAEAIESNQHETIGEAENLIWEFEVAANPVAILALLDELEACKADAERIERNRDMWKAQCEEQQRVLELLRQKPATWTNAHATTGKCLACGDEHHGYSGLPCPKMTPMAWNGKDG